MHLLLAGTFGIKFLSVLLFMLGICEVLIRIQQMSLNNYAVKDLSPFYFSASSIVTGAGGIMIIDNSFINFLNFASVINVLTSVISSRIAYGKYAQLNRLKACSTYQPNVSESCLSSYDNSSSVLSEPVIIVNPKGTSTVELSTPSSLVEPEILTSSEDSVKYLYDANNVKENKVETPSLLEFSPIHHHLANTYYSNDTNTTYRVSEYEHEVQCYGDSDYFLSAYYCEFYQIARNNERKDYCYCVTDATPDSDTTCFEYKLYPFCGDLLEQLPILTRSTYIVATLCWILSFLLTCILCIITQKNHGRISLSVLFYFKEYSERVVPHKMAVAEYAGSDVVMADVLEVRPVEEVEMTPSGTAASGAGGTGAAAAKEGVMTSGRDLEAPPMNDDLVREFDAVLPAQQPQQRSRSSSDGEVADAAPGQGYSRLPTTDRNTTTSAASASPLRSTAATTTINNNSSSSSGSTPAAPVSLVTASPVAAARNFLRFSSRVAPVDSNIDIANIAPIQAYEL